MSEDCAALYHKKRLQPLCMREWAGKQAHQEGVDVPPPASRRAGLPCANTQQHVQLRHRAALQLRPQRILRRKRVGA